MTDMDDDLYPDQRDADQRGETNDELSPARRDQGPIPWFGPKRFGYGMRPQTWQGYLISGVVVVVVLALTVGTRHGLTPYMVPVVLLVVMGIAHTTIRRR